MTQSNLSRVAQQTMPTDKQAGLTSVSTWLFRFCCFISWSVWKGSKFQVCHYEGKDIGKSHRALSRPITLQFPRLLVWGCFHAGQRIIVRSEHLQLTSAQEILKWFGFDRARKAVFSMRLWKIYSIPTHTTACKWFWPSFCHPTAFKHCLTDWSIWLKS